MRNSARRNRGFTLVELLVVIMLIMIVAGMGFSLLGRGRKMAKIATAARETVTLAASLKAYQLEYGRYPLQSNTTDQLYNDFSDELLSNCFAILRGRYYETENPRAVSFMELIPDQDLNSDYLFEDPWGEVYRFMADWDDDHALTIPGHTNAYQHSVAWSYGPDMRSDSDERSKDDVLSWQ